MAAAGDEVVPLAGLSHAPCFQVDFFFFSCVRATTRALERIVFFARFATNGGMDKLCLVYREHQSVSLRTCGHDYNARGRFSLDSLDFSGCLWCALGIGKMINPQPPCALLCSAVVAVAVARLLGLRSLGSNRSWAVVVIVFGCFWWMR